MAKTSGTHLFSQSTTLKKKFIYLFSHLFIPTGCLFQWHHLVSQWLPARVLNKRTMKTYYERPPGTKVVFYKSTKKSLISDGSLKIITAKWYYHDRTHALGFICYTFFISPTTLSNFILNICPIPSRWDLQLVQISLSRVDVSWFQSWNSGFCCLSSGIFMNFFGAYTHQRI